MKEIDISYLRECFYSREGVLYWSTARPLSHFRTRAAYKRYLIMRATNAAGSPDKDGYIRVCINGSYFSAHRIIWALAHNRWPLCTIDHIDGDVLNNNIDNLRDVSNQVNLKNSSLSIRNKSGTTGVYWMQKRNKWFASICVNSRLKYLGYFDLKIEAINARKRAEIEHGYHLNHGR